MFHISLSFLRLEKGKEGENTNEAWSKCERGGVGGMVAGTFHLGRRCKVMKLTLVSTPLGWACMDHYRQGERTAQSQRTLWSTHIHTRTHKEVYTHGRNENVQYGHTWHSFLRASSILTHKFSTLCVFACMCVCVLICTFVRTVLSFIQCEDKWYFGWSSLSGPFKWLFDV